MKKANILFIMTDQQRWDALGCSGGWVKTPNLDRIADEGITFSNCVTNAPECIPTRVSLATGLYPHNTGVWDNCQYSLPETTFTWMQAVRDAGYRTSLFGKMHLHGHSDLRKGEYLLHAYGLDDVDEIAGPRGSMHQLSNMTERWKTKGLWEQYQEDFRKRLNVKSHMVRPSTLPLSEYADVYVGQQAKRYLVEYARPEPWFCWVSFGGPHEPWDAPEPYASMYSPDQMPKAVLRPERATGSSQGHLNKLLDSSQHYSLAEIAAMRANYAGNVSLIDDQIGEILDVIGARGELENTIIAFCSDHGEMNGDYGLIYKSNFLNGAVRVPLLLRTPDTITSPYAGTVLDSLVEWFDIGPTLVELAGGEMRHRHFARSLCHLLKGTKSQHRAFAISEFGGEIMILDSKWKMALNTQGVPYLLFNMERDPEETNNLSGTRAVAKTEKELSLRILEHLVQSQVVLNGGT